jgi:transposase-like protein
MMKERRTFTPEQKVNIVLEVLREERTLNEIGVTPFRGTVCGWLVY